MIWLRREHSAGQIRRLSHTHEIGWKFLCCFVVYSTRRFVLCLTLCYFILCFVVLLALRLPRLGKIELILVLFVRVFDLCLFGFVFFLFLLVPGKGCGLWLWHSLDFSLTFFFFFFFFSFSLPRWKRGKGGKESRYISFYVCFTEGYPPPSPHFCGKHQ